MLGRFRFSAWIGLGGFCWFFEAAEGCLSQEGTVSDARFEFLPSAACCNDSADKRRQSVSDRLHWRLLRAALGETGKGCLGKSNGVREREKFAGGGFAAGGGHFCGKESGADGGSIRGAPPISDVAAGDAFGGGGSGLIEGDAFEKSPGDG